MKGRAIKYSAEEMAWLEDNRTLVIGDYHQQFCRTFSRTDIAAVNLHSLRKRKGWLTGRTGRFEKGQESWNKGKPHPSRGRSATTQFRKGQLPHNTLEIGCERVTRDGYTEISVAETNPYTGAERRFVLKHKYLWERRNGPLPKGMCLKCLDGDRQNTDPANWEAIPRALLPRLSGRFGRDYDGAPEELKPIIMATAKLQHHARTTARRAKATEA